MLIPKTIRNNPQIKFNDRLYNSWKFLLLFLFFSCALEIFVMPDLLSNVHTFPPNKIYCKKQIEIRKGQLLGERNISRKRRIKCNTNIKRKK